jgi:hypothetical protein
MKYYIFFWRQRLIFMVNLNLELHQKSTVFLFLVLENAVHRTVLYEFIFKMYLAYFNFNIVAGRPVARQRPRNKRLYNSRC